MKQKTYYHIILDQSGSMADCIGPTISGFNEQLQLVRSLGQQHTDQEIRFGLTRFNHEVMHTYFAADPASVKELTTKIYQPNGTTALLDAIGTTVTRLQTDLYDELALGIATVVIVILTDGYENASVEYTQPVIPSMIKSLEATGKWTFSYLGATLDAVNIAKGLNIKGHNAMAYDKAQTGGTFNRLSRSMNSYMEKRSTGGDLSKFLEEDK